MKKAKSKLEKYLSKKISNNKKDTGNHNKLFFSFRNKFKRLNLKLSY